MKTFSSFSRSLRQKHLFPLALFLASAVLMSACSSSRPALPCGPESSRNGRYCYRGIDFGRQNDPDFRQGIRDGCETGRGYFRKEYRRSAASPAYREGWVLGRARCRPEPLRKSRSRRSASARYRSEGERTVIRAYPRDERQLSHPRHSDEGPEVIRYDR